MPDHVTATERTTYAGDGAPSPDISERPLSGRYVRIPVELLPDELALNEIQPGWTLEQEGPRDPTILAQVPRYPSPQHAPPAYSDSAGETIARLNADVGHYQGLLHRERNEAASQQAHHFQQIAQLRSGYQEDLARLREDNLALRMQVSELATTHKIAEIRHEYALQSDPNASGFDKVVNVIERIGPPLMDRLLPQLAVSGLPQPAAPPLEVPAPQAPEQVTDPVAAFLQETLDQTAGAITSGEAPTPTQIDGFTARLAELPRPVLPDEWKQLVLVLAGHALENGDKAEATAAAMAPILASIPNADLLRFIPATKAVSFLVEADTPDALRAYLIAVIETLKGGA